MAPLYGSAVMEWSDHNMMPNSELFSAWSLSGTPGVVVGEDDPYGGTNAYLLSDDTGGASEYIYEVPASFSENGTKTLGMFLKEGASPPAGGSEILLYDVTAAVTRLQSRISWAAGSLVITHQQGTHYFEREWLNGWWRHACNTISVIAANTHQVQIFPARVAAQTGDIRIFGCSLQDVPTAGGYVRTRGEALIWDGESGQMHTLRVPLQKLLPAGSMYRAVRESADRHVREVVTVGKGVNEITARIRYDEAPAELNEMIRAGVAGHPLVYIPDSNDLDTAYEMELLEPGADWVQQMDEDWVVFQETAVPVRLRRMDGGSLSGLFAA